MRRGFTTWSSMINHLFPANYISQGILRSIAELLVAKTTPEQNKREILRQGYLVCASAPYRHSFCELNVRGTVSKEAGYLGGNAP